MPKFSGSAGGSGGGASLLKAEYTTVSTEGLVISGLDLETDKSYRVEANLVNGGNGVTTFTLNGDTNGGHYKMRYQMVNNSGTASAGTSNNQTPNIFGNFPIVIEMFMTKKVGEHTKIHFRIASGDDADTNEQYIHGVIEFTPTTNITSLKIAAAGAAKAGDYARVLKTA